MKRIVTAWLAAAALSACTLMPHYQRPQSPVPDRWPADAGAPVTAASAAAPGVTPGAAQPGVSADQIGWRDFFTDPRLAASHRDRTRQQPQSAHRRAERRGLRGAVPHPAWQSLPCHLRHWLGSRSRGCPRTVPCRSAASAARAAAAWCRAAPAATTFHYYSAGIGFTNYELDLFGRERSLTTRRLRAVSGAERDAAAARRSASSPRWPPITSRCSPTRHS